MSLSSLQDPGREVDSGADLFSPGGLSGGGGELEAGDEDEVVAAAAAAGEKERGGKMSFAFWIMKVRVSNLVFARETRVL